MPPGERPFFGRALVCGREPSAARLRMIAAARRTTRSCSAADRPPGSRCTSSVRLRTGNANGSSARCSASIASASARTRSPSAPVCASSRLGSASVHATAAASQAARAQAARRSRAWCARYPPLCVPVSRSASAVGASEPSSSGTAAQLSQRVACAGRRRPPPRRRAELGQLPDLARDQDRDPDPPTPRRSAGRRSGSA